MCEYFGVTGTLGAGYEHDRQPGNTSRGGGYTSPALDGRGFYAALTPGVVFFSVPKFSTGASVGSLNYYYLRLSVKPDIANVNSSYEDIASTFGANFGLNQLTFGSYYFGR